MGGITCPHQCYRTPECLKAVGRSQLVLPRGRPTVTLSPLAVPFFCLWVPKQDLALSPGRPRTLEDLSDGTEGRPGGADGSFLRTWASLRTILSAKGAFMPESHHALHRG